jgi:hypothetical protein
MNFPQTYGDLARDLSTLAGNPQSPSYADIETVARALYHQYNLLRRADPSTSFEFVHDMLTALMSVAFALAKTFGGCISRDGNHGGADIWPTLDFAAHASL